MKYFFHNGIFFVFIDNFFFSITDKNIYNIIKFHFFMFIFKYVRFFNFHICLIQFFPKLIFFIESFEEKYIIFECFFMINFISVHFHFHFISYMIFSIKVRSWTGSSELDKLMYFCIGVINLFPCIGIPFNLTFSIFICISFHNSLNKLSIFSHCQKCNFFSDNFFSS